MCLTTMTDAFRNQLDDPKFKEVPFEDRFGMLVDIEFSNRKNNRQKRLIHNAGFEQAAVKLTWPVPLAWRLVSSISILGMSVFLICLLIWRWRGQMAATKKSWLSMPIPLS